MTDYQVTHLSKYNPDKNKKAMTTDKEELMTDSEKLRIMAKWFDIQFKDDKTNNEVQRDLRLIADKLEAKDKENEELKATIERRCKRIAQQNKELVSYMRTNEELEKQITDLKAEIERLKGVDRFLEYLFNLAPVVTYHCGFIVLAQNGRDMQGKCIAINKGETLGFYTGEKLYKEYLTESK